MRKRHDLSELAWTLSGWTPYLWMFEPVHEFFTPPKAEIPAVPANVPGSVQWSLRAAGLLPDWNTGFDSRACEWVENRHWLYETTIPDDWPEDGKAHRLECLGLDYSGWVVVNGRTVGEFRGSFIPRTFDITPYLQAERNVLQIVFDVPPRWLGQYGYTSRMRDWKPRFNYTWDWVVRFVQTGIWDAIYLHVTDQCEISDFRCVTHALADGVGALGVTGHIPTDEDVLVRLSLAKDDSVIREQELSRTKFNAEGITWTGLPVEVWWPNIEGPQPLYTVCCSLVDNSGSTVDCCRRQVGFKNVNWLQCQAAPDEADPWVCAVNGRQVFLRGVNWTPIRPNYADVAEEDYRKRLETYRDIGFNILRVWGGAFLEKECFYDLCDELGLMVWQEFPLCSSGMDDYPPDDDQSISELVRIARSYIARRQHHVSLTVWSGGNELIQLDEYQPITEKHPLIRRLRQIVEEEDPTRRFLATSPSGPSVHGNAADYGKGIHWDVHGPWGLTSLTEWARYWEHDDSLFRSEAGVPSASPAEIIRQYSADCAVLPASRDNAFWNRPPSPYSLQWDDFAAEIGRLPHSLEEYVDWSQRRQAQALEIAVESAWRRFPGCGGILIWMGHDCFPCAINTSIVDYHGNPKPAAVALQRLLARLTSMQTEPGVVSEFLGSSRLLARPALSTDARAARVEEDERRYAGHSR